MPHAESMELETLRSTLKSQYHASLEMLRETIENCHDDLWLAEGYTNASWQVAYHVLYFTHLYLQTEEAAFEPWEQQQNEVQHPDGIPGPADPDSALPLIPRPYSRQQVLAYWEFCDGMVGGAVDAMDLSSPQSGFPRYKVSKLEHQLINIRHIQHHMAQLADRLRSELDLGTRWVGAKRNP